MVEISHITLKFIDELKIFKFILNYFP